MADTLPPDALTYPDGQPIIVCRPARPLVVKALAQIALDKQDGEALRATYDEPMRMLGWLVRRDGQLLAVDAAGGNAVPLAEGDVLTSPNSMRQAG